MKLCLGKGLTCSKSPQSNKKSSAKATEQLHGCPLLPGKAAGRWHCPAQAPSRGHLPPAPARPPAPCPARNPAFWEGIFPKEQFRSACYKWLKNEFFLKSVGALLCCAEPKSSPSSGRTAGKGSVPPLPPPVPCNLPSPPSIPPPKLHIFVHPSGSLLEKNRLEAHGVGWAGEAGCSSPPESGHSGTALAPTRARPRPPPSSSSATKGCGERLGSGRRHRIPGKNGSSFPWLSQQWLNNTVCPCPPPRSAVAVALRLRGIGMLFSCGSVQWETSLPKPAPSCSLERSSPFGGSTWCYGRVLLVHAWIARC